MTHCLFMTKRGMLKRKPPGYFEKIEQLTAELAGSCPAMPKAGAHHVSERASPPVRRWWNEGAFA